MSGATPDRSTLRIDSRHLMDLYLRGEHDALSDAFLGVLGHFHDTTYFTFDPQARRFINVFVKEFLNLFTQPDYIPAASDVTLFLQLNPTISNLVALSDFQTTDPYLELMRQQGAPVVKILTLLSARNSARFDRKEFFDADAANASLWYNTYAESATCGLIDARTCRNLEEHFQFDDVRYDSTFEAQALYFGSTYLDGRTDRVVKSRVNRCFQRVASRIAPQIRNTPQPGKFALFSSCWYPSHSVYRTLFAYVKELQGYHKTFYQLGKYGKPPDTSLFDEVRQIGIRDNAFDINPLVQNDITVAYFPEIGISKESLMLANLRFAPIQISGTGHPVTTGGAEIDYFISGADVEVPEHPERNYSERLVLLPGWGAIHNRPIHEPTGRRKSVPEFVVNCPWAPMKVNARFLGTIRDLITRSPRPLRFRIFAGAALARHNDYLPFVRNLQAVLGPVPVEVLANLPYPEYMGLMEEGDLTIDSFPFGGSNIVTDSLYLGKPIVTWEGDKWYARIGSQMLRSVGLSELAARSEQEYLDIILKLIGDDTYRADVEQRLRQADLAQTIFSTRDARYFGQAIDYLVENHERLKNSPDRSPIRIAR